MMRVAIIVPGFSAAENDWCIPALLNFARAVAQLVEVEVFALRYPHRRADYHIGHASVHSLGWAQRRGVYSLALWDEAIRAIARRHHEKPFDLLHAFWADEPGWIGAVGARRLGLPLVISLAGGELSDLPRIGYGLQRHPLQRRLIAWALRSAACVTAGSQYLLDLARAHHLKPLALAPLGVDTKMFCPMSQVACPTFNLVNIGSLAPVKGQFTLLRAMRRVADALPDVHLRIVGAGPLKRDLIAEINRLALREHVTLCDLIAHDQLPTLYRSADLFVQASLHEAQGMAVLEAAACGVPIVGTHVGILRELAPEAAWAVPVGDKQALACAIIELAKDEERRKWMGHTARARVEEFYRVEKCVERFDEWYREVRTV